MKNKRVKQMMATGYDKSAILVGYWCQRQENLINCARFMRGQFLWWPKCGVVSLTADQHKAIK